MNIDPQRSLGYWAQDLHGPIVTIDDELWDEFVEGSLVAVRVCAKFLEWVNYAYHAEVRFWRWFEPVIDIE